MNSELNRLTINDLNNNKDTHGKLETENQKQNINAITNKYVISNKCVFYVD